MSQHKKEVSKWFASTAETRELSEIKAKTGNIYESIAIISKRANQINTQKTEELHSKLEEFISHTDNLEEIHENKEQIEISKYYERQPNPPLVALTEFMDDEIYFRSKDEEVQFG